MVACSLDGTWAHQDKSGRKQSTHAPECARVNWDARVLSGSEKVFSHPKPLPGIMPLVDRYWKVLLPSPLNLAPPIPGPLCQRDTGCTQFLLLWTYGSVSHTFWLLPSLEFPQLYQRLFCNLHGLLHTVTWATAVSR